MANWTYALTGIAKSTTSANVIATITLTNSVSGEIQTQSLPVGGQVTANWFRAQGEQAIQALNQRDATYTTISAALTAASGNLVLATG